jgi:hypothetical protein
MQESMMTFNFDIIYQKGSEMPADFLSQNVVYAIKVNLNVGLERDEMEKTQDQEDWI